MNNIWTYKQFAELFEVGSGLSKPAGDFGSGYPFLSFKKVFNNYYLEDELTDLVVSTPKEWEKCSVQKGDVFLTRTSETLDELGMSCVALRDYPKATFNGFTKRLRPKTQELDSQFVAYYLRSPEFRGQITSMATMTTRASLNNEMIGRLSLPVPPLAVQIKIRQVLKTIDDKIKINNKTNGNLTDYTIKRTSFLFICNTDD